MGSLIYMHNFEFRKKEQVTMHLPLNARMRAKIGHKQSDTMIAIFHLQLLEIYARYE